MSDRQREILGILLIAIGCIVFLSLISYHPGEEPTISKNVVIHNWMGILGIIVSNALIRFTIGYASLIFPFLVIIWGWWVFARKPVRPLLRLSIHLVVLAIIAATVMGLPDAVFSEGTMYEYRYSGLVGGVAARVLHDFLGLWGTLIILGGAILVTVRSYFSLELYAPFRWIGDKWSGFLDNRRRMKAAKQSAAVTGDSVGDAGNESVSSEGAVEERTSRSIRRQSGELSEETPLSETPSDANQRSIEEEEPADGSVSAEHHKSPADKHTAEDGDGGYSMGREVIEESIDYDSTQEEVRRREYHLPSVDLLEAPDQVEEGTTQEELVNNADLLERTLREFGVEATVVHIAPGPIITRYELEPAKGVRINKFTALADDLARVMEAQRVRVLAPIPGKAAVGIEIPNKRGSTVYLKHIINSKAYTNSEHPLTIAMGKTTSGEAYVANLARMPHVLIAGATGSGKSVCINSMIMSLLYRNRPDELKLILIDPKKLELSIYEQLAHYHLITSEDIDEDVITKPANAVNALRSAEIEMERRYELLSDATVRNIDEYNAKIEQGEYEGDVLPYIVVIIDELADLMITAAKEVEEPISRLAQMARAVGIHLVVATQRPSVDVLTGVIKANFPARIAFQVASKTDSRTILDANGAEKLLGRGDMLYQPPASPEPVRLHNAYVSLGEIEEVLAHIGQQPRADELELPGVQDASPTTSFSTGQERDELFREALELVVRHQQGSISLLQRRLRIGYSRAARIIDELEEAGIVGGHEGSKARDVLVDEEFLEKLESGEVEV